MFSPDTMKPNCCESTAVNLKHAATFFFFFSEPTRGAYFILWRKGGDLLLSPHNKKVSAFTERGYSSRGLFRWNVFVPAAVTEPRSQTDPSDSSTHTNVCILAFLISRLFALPSAARQPVIGEVNSLSLRFEGQQKTRDIWVTYCSIYICLGYLTIRSGQMVAHRESRSRPSRQVLVQEETLGK